MGGGSGGYDRPSDDSGSGGSSDSNEDGPVRVPPPESEPEEETVEDQSDESDEATDDTTSPPIGGGGGTGSPIAGPGEGAGGTPEEDDSHRDEGSDGQDKTDSGSEDEPEDTNSQRDDQKDNQRDREERQEDQERETDDEESDEQEDEDNEDDENEDEDECLIAESTLLHSPNPEPLEDAAEDDICSVQLREGAACVVNSQGQTIGSIAEPWVGTLKECIEQGRQYRARILDINGGKCEVKVTNRCILNRNVNLSAINTEVRDQLHSGLSLSVEATTEGVIVVTNSQARVGDIPKPWAKLLKECIDQGLSYRAEVREVTPEYCTVNIQNGRRDE